MSSVPNTSSSWVFTRSAPFNSNYPFFRADLRLIAGQQEDYDLPWQDDMYLAYPSLEAPNWPAFVAHVTQLNKEADDNTHYKIIYIMRRAHKTAQDNSELGPALDDLGKDQCSQLVANFDRAMRTVSLPPPEVVVTSPLARALETIKLGVTPLFPSIRPIVLESLREGLTGTGKNQRHGKTRIKENFPTFDVDHVDELNQLETPYHSPNRKETYEALWQRVRGAFAYVFENHRGALVVLLMSHCHVEQTIQREITGWDVPKEERRKTVEFFVGEVRGYAIVVKGART